MSVLMFTTIAIICFYTGILLQRCIDSSSLVKTYPDIGELAFGRKGRIIVAIFMYLELYLVAIDFMILEGDNLEKLFPSVDFHVAGLKIGGKQGFVLIDRTAPHSTHTGKSWTRRVVYLGRPCGGCRSRRRGPGRRRGP